MNDRIQATIDRVENIMTRIVSRIEKIKDNGGNTTEADKLVDQAKISLDKAKASFVLLKAAEPTSSTATSTPVKDMIAMRKQAKDVIKNLIDAHKSLMKVVGVLRGDVCN
jgi:hypothetical protein